MAKVTFCHELQCIGPKMSFRKTEAARIRVFCNSFKVQLPFLNRQWPDNQNKCIFITINCFAASSRKILRPVWSVVSFGVGVGL